MKNKRTYIILGIIAFAVAAALCTFGMIQMFNFSSNIKQLILIFIIGLLMLGVSELLFVKSGIVPKWLKYLFLAHWFFCVVMFVLVFTFSYFFGGLDKILNN